MSAADPKTDVRLRVISGKEEPFQAGEWLADPVRCTLTRSGEVRQAEPKVMAVLQALVQRPGELVSKQDLIRDVWEGRFVTEDVITVAIYELRKVLGDSARHPQFIETVPRHGYRWKFQPTVFEETKPAGAEDASPLFPRVRAAWPALAAVALMLAAIVSWQVLRGDVAKTLTPSSEALAAYERGLRLLNEGSRASSREAASLLGQAVTHDATFAEAHAALARALVLQADSGWGDRAELQSRAQAAVTRAFELRPDLPQAHAARGMLQFVLEWNFAAAEKSLRRAVQLQPTLMEAHQVLAWLLSATARHEQAIAHARQALSAGTVPYRHVEIAWALSYSGRYHDALAELDQAIRQEPHLFEAHISRGMILELLGDTNGAYTAIREAYAGMPSGANFTQRLDDIYAREGLRGVYRAWLQISQSGRAASMPKSEVWHASLYSRIGEVDSAIAALQRAYERHEGGLAWLRVEPSFMPLRYDARYQSIVQRVGLVN